MKNRIPVGILGATGSVGQKFLEVLNNHPWFEVTALCSSQKKVGLTYEEAADWFQNLPCPEAFKTMKMEACQPGVPCKIVFSGLDSSVAGPIETEFAEAGYVVISNCRNHRMDPLVPLVIPEVNPDHLDLLKEQKTTGKLITNPNCSTIGLVLVLKPLWDLFGIEAVNVVTLQALSGAGYPGVSSLDILDNVIPFISGEEKKMETEPLKLFGTVRKGVIEPADFAISAQCNRVAVANGHLERVSVKLKKKATLLEVRRAIEEFQSPVQHYQLPSSPSPCLRYFDDPRFPQPRKHHSLGEGMMVSVGHLAECPVLDFKFSLLVHNTVRGAAGGALLNAELMVAQGYFND